MKKLYIDVTNENILQVGKVLSIATRIQNMKHDKSTKKKFNVISFCNGFLKSMNKHTIFQHEEIQIHTNSVKCVGVSVIVPNLDGPVLKETFF